MDFITGVGKHHRVWHTLIVLCAGLLLAACDRHSRAPTVAPFFTQQPQSVAVQSGETARFTVAASGTPAPTIQWYRVGSPDQAVGSPCAPGVGSTSCAYTTAPLSVADSGARFYARASSSAGSVDSQTVTLTVTAPVIAPSITTEPDDQTVAEGANATFAVAASGTAPLSYQWQRNGADIAGANAASYTLTNVQLADDGALLRVVISNSAGSVTSRAARLTVTPQPPAPPASAGTCTSSNPAGWCWVKPTPHGNGLSAIGFDGGDVLVFGAAGTRMVSSDDGSTWQTSFGRWSSVDSASPNDVAVPQPNTVVAAASDGIWRSTDAGQTWTQVLALGTTLSVNSLAFRDANNGIAVGDAIWRTSDGGVTWTQVTAPADIFLNRVAISGGVYVAVGYGGVPGGGVGSKILRSTDQGATWVDIDIGGSTEELVDVAFDGNGNGVAISDDRQYLRTSDRGLTWTPDDFGTIAAGSVKAVAFTGPGTAVTAWNCGAVLRSNDSGVTWQSNFEPAWDRGCNSGKLALRFRDANLGLVVGDYGMVSQTTDGGESWTRVAGGAYFDQLDAIRFGAGGIGLAAGIDASVLRTNDAGATWTSFRIDDPTSAGAEVRGIGDLAFAGSTVFAAGYYGRVYRSTDGGQNWTVAYQEGVSPRWTKFLGIDFVDANTGVVVGIDANDQGVVRRTTDGGQTWSVVSIPSSPIISSVRFGSPTVGLAAGGTTLLRTTDGGQTWSKVTVSPLYPFEGILGLTFISPTTVVMSTDFGLNRSTDGGLTWTRVADFFQRGVPVLLESVAFGDANTGVAVGDNIILRTTDGGVTWTPVDAPFSAALQSTAYASSGTVIAVGNGGAILRNTQGGAP